MLDDAEERRLAEIESWFEANDPKLTRRLMEGRLRRRVVTAAVAVITMVVAVIVGYQIAGPPAAIAAGLTVVAVACGLWLQRRHTASRVSPPDT